MFITRIPKRLFAATARQQTQADSKGRSELRGLAKSENTA
jgi:hypothetical protein